MTMLLLLFYLAVKSGIFCADIPKLEWIPASVGDCRNCSGLNASSASISVPASYEPISGNVNMFVKRYMSKSVNAPKYHIIMLPGGPGQDGTVLESHVGYIEGYVGGSVAIYLVDMRCTGQSDAFSKPDDYEWVNNADAVMSKSTIPALTITLSNAARDGLILGKAIKSSLEFGKDSSLTLFGVSFGATWAIRALQLDKDNLFDNAILDSLAPLSGLVAPDNDEGLLDNCNAHPYCRAQFDGDAKTSRDMLKEILANPKRNECSSRLTEAFKLCPSNLSPEYCFFLIAQPAIEGGIEGLDTGKRTHPTQLYLAFIKATHLCADPQAYEKILGEVIEYSGIDGAIGSSGGSRRRKTKGLLARASDNDIGGMNMVVNNLFFTVEAYNIPNGGNANCGPSTIFHQCFLYDYYTRLYPSFQKYVAPRDTLADSGFSTKAKIHIVHGQMDMLTAIGPAMRSVGKIQAAKREFIYRNMGHSIITEGDCAAFIWKEAITGTGSAETDACMKATNSTPLDWTFRDVPKYKNWWDSSIPVTFIEEPVVPGARRGGGLSRLSILMITSVVIIVVGGGLAYYFAKKSLPVKAKPIGP